MSIFTQSAAQIMNQQSTATAATKAATAASKAAMASTQACQNQQTAQNQQTQRQSQDMYTNPPTFTQAENNPVFCFFYSYPPSCTHFNQRSEEIMNHAHKGGARI